MKPRLKGKAHEIRFADDAILCFQRKEDAQKVLNVLPKRFAKYGLTHKQQQTLNAKLRGHYQYYGRPTNYRSLRQFYRKVRRIWREELSRRTRGRWLTWERYAAILHQHPLLQPRITHSWARPGGPLEEPAAVILHGGVREGGVLAEPG